MGRNSTGAFTTSEIQRIELSYLLKNGYIQKGERIAGVLEWNSGNSINIESYYTNDEAYIKLTYTNTNGATKEVTKHDSKIQLTSIPSNLKVGSILYFVCPQTGKSCRILYKCYGSNIWKSRLAYNHRIYFNTQQVSKRDYYFTRYFSIEKELKKLYPIKKKSHYKGKQTRLQKRIVNLEEQLSKFDYLRMMEIEKVLNKIKYS